MSKAKELLNLIEAEPTRRIVRPSKSASPQATSQDILKKLDSMRLTLSKEDKYFLASYIADGSLALDKDKMTVFRKLFKDKGAAKDMADTMSKIAVKVPEPTQSPTIPPLDQYNPETDAHLLTSELVHRLMQARPDGVPVSTIEEWATEVLVMNAMGDEAGIGSGIWVDGVAEQYPFMAKVWDKMYKDYEAYFKKDQETRG